MHHGATSVVFAILALVQPVMQPERPSWVETEEANFPVEIASMVFPNGTVVDETHSNMTVGRWQITRAGPLTERLRATQLENGVTCLTPSRGDCFYALIAPFSCYNAASPAYTYCAMALSWSLHDTARCKIFAGPPARGDGYPEGGTSFGIACPTDIRYVK